MSIWRQLARGLRALTHRSSVEKEISDEVQHFLEEETEEQIARGYSREEATRIARLEFGSHTNVQEHVRSYGWENAIETLFADLLYAFRQLKTIPVFTAVAILTVAIGVGATTAIFSAVYPILFEPLPYPNANRMTAINEMNTDGSRLGGTFGMYRGLVKRSRAFEAISVLKPWHPAITGSGQPEQLNGQRVSSTYFHVLGASPFIGRDFRSDEDRVNGANVLIFSFQLWQRNFGGDKNIIGRRITLDDQTYSIIGVMRKDFENVLSPSADVWAPLQYDMSQGRAWGHHLRTIGRLRRGVTIKQATQEVGVIGRDVLQEKRPDTYGPGVRLIACSLQQELTRGVKPALLAILGAAFLVLLIACVNVTNLLLSRGVQRRGEFAMRAALGASKARLTRQLLTECLVLALLGGVLGLLVAAFGTHALIALSPADLPRSNAIGVDRAVFAFAFCITSLIGIAFGLVPAQQASHSNLRDSLEQSTHRTARQHTRARKLLVVGEVALALVLLVSSGLLWRSLERLFAVDVGFDPSQILTMQIQLSGNNFQNHEQIDPFFAQIIQSVQQVPGVTSAALTSQLPLSGDLDEYGVSFEATPNQPTETFNSFRYAVSPVYIQTMRISLLSGRSLNANDREATPFVALISESLAKLRFGHRDPIGNRLRIGPMDGVPYTIVGVVKDIKQMSLAASESSAVYIPASQWPFPDKTMSIVARTSNPQRANGASVPHAELSAFRQAIWSVDKNQPISRVATMDELLAATAAERRFSLILFEAFALAALVLAAAGIYGVLAGSVAERTREIGVRSALGASRMGIVAMILRQGITLTGIGIVIGVIGAAVVTQAIIAMLFQVSHLDLFTYLGVIALLTLVAAIASAVPAYRASLVDPANTLRAQ